MTARYKDWLAGSYMKEMSNQHSVQALSWRRFYLARAKLKASSRTSALLSGFAMVAMVEAQISETMPIALLIVFSICTTLVVAIHLLALMISTCILPNMEAVSNVHNVTAVMESPHDKMHWYIELAWIFSTGIGILLFLVEMAILAWVRFLPADVENATWASFIAPMSSTIIILPCLLIFVIFAIRFYRQLITHKYERHTQGLEELETMANELNTNNVSNSLIQNV